MSNVIRFLESMGANATGGRVSAMEYAAAVEILDVEPRLRQALQDRDVPALTGLLNGRAKMFCMIVAPESEEEQQEVPGGTDDEPEKKQPDSE